MNAYKIPTQKQNEPRRLGWSKFRQGRRWLYRYCLTQQTRSGVLERSRLFTWHELYALNIPVETLMAEIEREVARELELAAMET